ncbi:branched-chain amino acid transport azld [Lucifera butyrica]|uniref:Branched-chain amino acid transport azld n=1 Tax=Lucifera butyrica TaxID=1351585 RepID=A0A498R6I9_9FIRM|nr:branched-chain amino acid transport azld [Lucifera butyrica]VBB08408.1 branched-chain amino acid transport azld [Lucifera butyrica]
MNITDIYLSILIIAAVTFFTRAFPFLFFHNRKPPEIILFVGKHIPPIIITILVIYCLKDIHWNQAPYGLNECIAVALVIILHLWRRNSLISIFGATIVYMFLIQSNFLTNLIH